MTVTASDVMSAYNAGVAEVSAVLDSFTATRAQKDAAERSLAALTTTLAQHSVQQVEGRTAVLAALVTRLNEVIAKIRVNPVGDLLDGLTRAVGTASNLLSEATGGPTDAGDPGSPAAVESGDIRRLVFAVESTLLERLDSTVDTTEVGEIRDQIATLADLKERAVTTVVHARLAVLSELANLVETCVANLRHGPFDRVLGRLQSISDDVARSRSDTMREVRGGTAEADPPAPDQPAEDAPPPAESGLSTSRGFDDLKSEYARLFRSCRVRDERLATIRHFYLKPLLEGRSRYEQVAAELGIPWWFIGIIHGLESTFNFGTHLHNGDPLDARTVQHPAGRPREGSPPFTWKASAIDALRHRKLDQVGDWSLPHAMHLWEAYNGFGYRDRGVASPYLWSFSNHFEKGKFVADHVFDPEAGSEQCGAATLLKVLVDDGAFSVRGSGRPVTELAAPAPGVPGLAEALASSPLESTARVLKFPKVLREGAKDTRTRCDVRAVQEWCCIHHCHTDIDGEFGAGTTGAVERFQVQRNLPASGVVDERTWLELTTPMLRALAHIEPDSGGNLYDVTLRVAAQHLAQHPIEAGKDNCGPWVRLYMDGKDGGDQLWCAGFVCFVVGQAARALGGELPFPRRVGVDKLVEEAKNDNRLLHENDVSTPARRHNRLRPGCLFVVRKTATDWTHVGIVTRIGDERFETIEGNTNDDGSRNGFEVCARSRSYTGKDFLLLD